MEFLNPESVADGELKGDGNLMTAVAFQDVMHLFSCPRLYP